MNFRYPFPEYIFVILVGIVCVIFMLTTAANARGWRAPDEGQMVQHIKTHKLDLKIVFIGVTDPSSKPIFEESYKDGQRTLFVSLVHGQYMYSVRTGEGIDDVIRIDFTEKLRYKDSPFNSYNWAWLTCFGSDNKSVRKEVERNPRFKEGLNHGSYFPRRLTYQILKPEVPSKFEGKTLVSYWDVKVDLSNDIFIKIDEWRQKRKARPRQPGIHKRFILTPEQIDNMGDENNDGIIDSYQIWLLNETHRHWKATGREHKDINNDTIADRYQTVEFYKREGMTNFMDMNRDGICDNYIGLVYRPRLKIAHYPKITVDISEDFFINKKKYMERYGGPRLDPELEIDWPETEFEPVDHRIWFIDTNNDGITDRFQNTKLFALKYPGITFVDNNNDTIYDGAQTASFYSKVGLDNFIDIDGDGLCDNYMQ